MKKKLKLVLPQPDSGLLVYTDGSYSPSTGNGGWGFLVVSDFKMYESRSGSMPGPTTNNRMELLAILQALINVEDPIDVTQSLRIITDSQSSIAGILKVTEKMREGITLSHQRFSNLDLLNQIAGLIVTRKRRVVFEWVKGHNGNHWNEKVDRLATDARIALDLKTT